MRLDCIQARRSFSLKFLHLFFLACLCLLLPACGGSGGSGGSNSSQNSSVLQNQTPLTFQYAEIAVDVMDQLPINSLSGGSGSGNLAFVSSNPDVASVVVGTGVVTLHSAGPATISVTKAGDTQYLATQASYELDVTNVAETGLSFHHPVVTTTVDSTAPENSLLGRAVNHAVVFSSSAPEVAEVDSETGAINAKTEGEALITAAQTLPGIAEPKTASFNLMVSRNAFEPFGFEYPKVSAMLGFPVQANPLSVPFEGASVIYSSSDPSIVSVDQAKGAASLLKKGSAIISASFPGDQKFLPATASYEVQETAVVDGLKVFLGSAGYSVEWTSQMGSIDVLFANQESCNPDNHTECSESNLTTIHNPEETPYLNVAFSPDSPTYLTLQNEEFRTSPLLLEPKKIPDSLGFVNKFIEFKDKLWAFDGFPAPHVWSTEDGVNWAYKNASGYSDRYIEYFSSVLEFKDRLFRITDGRTGIYAGVWRSADGENWTRVKAGMGTGGGGAIVFRDRIWMLRGPYSGADHHPYYAGISSSENGSEWVLERDNLPFGARSGFSLYADENFMYIAGGVLYGEDSGQQYFDDIWRTANGVDWEQVNDSSGLPCSRILRFNNKFYCFKVTYESGFGFHQPPEPSGVTNGELFVFESDDGTHWRQSANTLLHPHAESIYVVNFQDAVWIIAPFIERIWRSTDMVNWSEAIDTSAINWAPRH